MKEMTKIQKKKLIKIFSSLGLLILAITLPLTGYLPLLLFIPAYLISGFPTLRSAFINILHGEIFDENFLMSIATIGAFGLGEYPEAVAVMLFYQIGELFESYAVDKSRKSITSLMDLRADYANLFKDGAYVKVSPEIVNVGDLILIKPGEKVPLDGKIEKGTSSLDTKSLTGEAMPRDLCVGDEILSGFINLTGVLTVKVLKPYEESTVSKILDLVENASDKKADIETFITKFARYYTPVVVIFALGLAFLPPLFINGALFSDWIYRALTFLVISCPCALVISVPLTFFAGVGASSKKGILVKGSNFLESLAKVDTVVFDKTGTLTEGEFSISKVEAADFISSEKLIEYTAYAEHFSNHPISSSIKSHYSLPIETARITNHKELSGYGVEAIIDNHLIIAGNAKMMKSYGINNFTDNLISTTVHIAVDSVYAGYISLCDNIRSDSFIVIPQLKKYGIKKTVMLTGDKDETAQSVGKLLGINQIYSQLLPGDKVDKLEILMKESSTTGKLVFIGDGINDAPVLARADIGVAMGGLGSDAAIEAADVVIMTDEPSKIATVIGISRKTVSIAKQNVYFALGIKFGVLILGGLGIASIWAAVFADVGVTIIAIVNAMRALKFSN